jgi:hypothetical protein
VTAEIIFGVVPAKAGTPSVSAIALIAAPCRFSFERPSIIISYYLERPGLWVPAFAGTTIEFR